MLASELGLAFDDDDPVWCDAREVLITGGVRSGKSTRGAFKALCRSLNPNTKLIWFVGPEYPQAREEFRYVLEWGMRLGLIQSKDDYSMPADGICALKTITGCRIETRSAQHPERLASVAPDLIVLCEPGQMSPEVYETCLTRLLERRGDLWMVGTLEAKEGKPRWQWYEDFALAWHDNPAGSRERSFSLPSWRNLTIFPLGENDPEFVAQRPPKLSQYTYDRRYAGKPSGVDNPVFPLIWEAGADEFLLVPDAETRWVDGCIGIDWGTSWTHPSAIVVVRVDSYGRFWVTEGWLGIKATRETIISLVETFRHDYGIWNVCTDPVQTYLADDVDGVAASSAGRGPTSIRFKMANGLLEDRRLLFDLNGVNVREIWASMRSMGHTVDRQGRERYDYPEGDDLGQALMYAIELLVTGGDTTIPPIMSGGMRMRFVSAPSDGGRA